MGQEHLFPIILLVLFGGEKSYFSAGNAKLEEYKS